jgi:hypothetical protein
MGPLPTGADVLAFLGWDADTALSAQADAHVMLVAAMAKSYVRGIGFHATLGECEADLSAVIVSAAARSLTNPGQARRIEAGSFNMMPGTFKAGRWQSLLS